MVSGFVFRDYSKNDALVFLVVYALHRRFNSRNDVLEFARSSIAVVFGV